MKKVIGAVVAGTLVAGMASADISFKLQSRVRSSLYSQTETYAKNSKKSVLWDFGYSSHNDILGVYAKGENCGADVEIALQNGQSSYTGTEALADGSTQAIGMDGLYDGWMTFGALKVSFGRFESRSTDRYNKTVVQGAWTDSDTAKYGVSNLIGKGIATTALGTGATAVTMPGTTFLYDFNNATATAGTKRPALIFDYTVNADAAKVLLKGGFVASNYKEESENIKKGENQNLQGAGYVAELDVEAAPANLQLIFKMPTQHTLGFGAYADIKAVDNLKLALGFTYGQQSEYDVYTTATAKTVQAKWSAMAFDLRAFYAIDKALTVGAQVKYSSYKKDNFNDDKALAALEFIGTAQYVANDLLSAQLDVLYFMTGMGAEDPYKKYGYDVFGIRPAVKLNASKSAHITAGVEYKTALNAGDASDNESSQVTKASIAIPVICRVQL